MKNLFLFLFLLVVFTSKAQDNRVSGLNSRQFTKYWKVESESPDYKVTFQGDTAEIVSPKGLTLWRKEKMSGKVTIEYDACVVVESDGDRLSDLNCFWMASDPQYPDNLWKREKWRSGIFLNCYSLQLYYLGYGGNHNSTTRFRRYDGDESGITNPKARPAILKEYTDAGHLLKPNHWYHIKITNENNRVSYYIDGERLVDFRDAEPLREGAAWAPADVNLISNYPTVKLNEGTSLFTDLPGKIEAIAPELKGMKAFRFNGNEQREKGTSIIFETNAPVKLLVAYFKDDQKKYAKAPKLEIDASANDYGQAEPVLTNAIHINGMPLANIHAYSFPAGKHTPFYTQQAISALILEQIITRPNYESKFHLLVSKHNLHIEKKVWPIMACHNFAAFS